MTTKPRLGPDDPIIQAAFAGIYESRAKVHFKINPETGNHETVGVCKALAGLDIPYKNKMDLVHSFPFPFLAYSSASKRERALAKANKKPKPVRSAAAADADEDGLADHEAEADANSVGSKRNPEYFIVAQNNGYWGCFAAREGAVVAMFKTKQEAEAHIQELLRGGWSFRAFYGSKVKADENMEQEDRGLELVGLMAERAEEFGNLQLLVAMHDLLALEVEENSCCVTCQRKAVWLQREMSRLLTRYEQEFPGNRRSGASQSPDAGIGISQSEWRDICLS